VRLRVSDTGSGMSKDTVERAFEPFFTTKPKGKGTGLGLATIYGIVNQAGGQVRIHSTLGVGTTITVMLPVTEDDAVAGEAVEVLAEDGRGETILVVEDEPSLRALTARILVAHNYDPITASDGREALDRAAGKEIDLLLTDVVMPHILGHDLADRLGRTRDGLRVIYLSGYADTVLTDSKTLPANVTLLTKPVPERLLLSTIRRVLDA
jgi:CheY-like chemotaxis protein